MKQARTLNGRELKNLLTLVARRRYALRDRNMLLLTHWAGMRQSRFPKSALEKWTDHMRASISFGSKAEERGPWEASQER